MTLDEHLNDRHSFELALLRVRGRAVKDESVTLASGSFDTRTEAEAALSRGVSDGTYDS